MRVSRQPAEGCAPRALWAKAQLQAGADFRELGPLRSGNKLPCYWGECLPFYCI